MDMVAAPSVFWDPQPKQTEENTSSTQFYACQTLHHSAVTIERVQQTMVRGVHACIHSG